MKSIKRYFSKIDVYPLIFFKKYITIYLKNISQKYFSKIFCEVEKINPKLKTYHGSKKESQENYNGKKASSKEKSQSQKRQKIN